MKAQQAAVELWGVEMHRMGGMRAARLIDILERNKMRFLKAEQQEWALLDLCDGAEQAQVVLRELKAVRREGRGVVGVRCSVVGEEESGGDVRQECAAIMPRRSD